MRVKVSYQARSPVIAGSSIEEKRNGLGNKLFVTVLLGTLNGKDTIYFIECVNSILRRE